MALTCPTNLTGVALSFTEFIDCTTINISYDIEGAATLSFTVVAANAQPIDTSAYTDMEFGGINFTGYITGLTVKKIPGTVVYEHQYSISAIGCRV